MWVRLLLYSKYAATANYIIKSAAPIMQPIEGQHIVPPPYTCWSPLHPAYGAIYFRLTQ